MVNNINNIKVDLSTYRKHDIDTNLQTMGISPLDVMITGVTGAGKSTTLNSIFNKTVAKVGRGVAPETMDLTSYLNNGIRFWDTPGLGDSIEKDKQHKKKMNSLLMKTYSSLGHSYGYIDMCIVIVEGITRDLGTTRTLINDVIVPRIQGNRVLVAINQADVAMKGNHWNYEKNEPDANLIDFLEKKANDVQRRVKEDTGVVIPKPVYYSAEYNWNVKKFYDFIIDNMPKTKRKMICQEKCVNL